MVAKATLCMQTTSQFEVVHTSLSVAGSSQTLPAMSNPGLIVKSRQQQGCAQRTGSPSHSPAMRTNDFVEHDYASPSNLGLHLDICRVPSWCRSRCPPGLPDELCKTLGSIRLPRTMVSRRDLGCTNETDVASRLSVPQIRRPPLRHSRRVPFLETTVLPPTHPPLHKP